jgi:DNA polymerase III subunit chi
MAQIEFYVLEGSDARLRWRFACREVEKAYLAGEQVYVALEDEADLQAFDNLLWTFADRSFVPHEPLAASSAWAETPVLLGTSPAPAGAQTLVNLASALPGGLAEAARVIEIIDADEGRRRAGRVRFRQYRERGLEPQTRNIGAGDAAASSDGA